MKTSPNQYIYALIFLAIFFFFSHLASAGTSAVDFDEFYPGTPPAISEINQFKLDGQTLLDENSISTQDTVIFKVIANDLDGDKIKIEIELRQTTEPFTGIDDGGILSSEFVSPLTEAVIVRNGLVNGQYHWRARAVDFYGLASDWQEFGQIGNVDFEVNLSLSYKAANLAKELIYQPYLWGGKGWDYNQSLFAAANAIKTGYHYYNSNIKSIDIGIGVDCSGLVMWSYNRSFDPLKPFIENFVSYEGANGQYLNNTESINEVNLQPGDLMFFDFVDRNGNPNQDGFIDHVAMYVGKSGNFDVVQARSPLLGIRGGYKNDLKQEDGFVAFKQVISKTLGFVATAYSPIELVVTDPNGLTITSTTTILSEEEYIREVPGELYYSELERGADDYPIKRVYSPKIKTGDYLIKVFPMTGVSPTETYSLDFKVGEQTTIFAQDISLNQIPSNGYGIAVSNAGALNTFIPVLIDIKPDSYPNSINLGSNGVVPVAILGNNAFDVYQINPASVTVANASIKLKNNGQQMTNYEDVNGDGLTDLVVRVPTKSLQLTKDDIKANLEGKLFDGTIIKGSDSIRIVP